MTAFGKLMRLIVALASLGAAFLLLRNAGLPERPALSGYRLQDGSYVAPEIGAIAPPLSLLTLDHTSFTLRPYQSKVTVVNFWATWCQPCREELRQLQALFESNPDSIRVVAINLGEAPATVSKWVRELGLTFDVLMDPTQSSADSFRVRGLPTAFLLDAELRIHRIFYGILNRDTLLNAVNRITRSH